MLFIERNTFTYLIGFNDRAAFQGKIDTEINRIS